MTSATDALRNAYAGKRVLVTGHSGFKGGWLTLWLAELGAHVTGFSLRPPTSPSLFEAIDIASLCRSEEGDICSFEQVQRVVKESQPHVIFHLAAQPLVRESYARPLETLEANVMGVAHVLEAVRLARRPCAVVVVTSDKCYENKEWIYGYRENEPMGGHDVYSMSKGAAELVVASYRRSFFPVEKLNEHRVYLASARAGNVIGGGDWASDRLVPDAIRALSQNRTVEIRSPHSVRPWQHVLEPLGGYLLLGSRLLAGGANAAVCCDAFNLGPEHESTQTVEAVIRAVIDGWGSGSLKVNAPPGAPHEAKLLRLSIEKARTVLDWRPRWTFAEAIAQTVRWYRAYYDGKAGLRDVSIQQIQQFSEGRPS